MAAKDATTRADHGGSRSPQITVTGASISATLAWDGALTNLLNGTTSFPTTVGFHGRTMFLHAFVRREQDHGRLFISACPIRPGITLTLNVIIHRINSRCRSKGKSERFFSKHLCPRRRCPTGPAVSRICPAGTETGKRNSRKPSENLRLARTFADVERHCAEFKESWLYRSQDLSDRFGEHAGI